MKKRILSLALTLAMALSLAVPAFAAEDGWKELTVVDDYTTVVFSAVKTWETAVTIKGEAGNEIKNAVIVSIKTGSGKSVKINESFADCTEDSLKNLLAMGLVEWQDEWETNGFPQAKDLIGRDCNRPIEHFYSENGILESEGFDYFLSTGKVAPRLPVVPALHGDDGKLYLLYSEEDDAPAPAPAAEQPSSWAAETVQKAIDLGIVPNDLQSKYTQKGLRSEFCALAVGLYEAVKGAEITERKTFTDTDDVNIQKLAGLDIISGVGNGLFNPSGDLNREQAATLLCNLTAALGKPLPEAAPGFADNASISDWAAASVGKVQAAGLMNGVGANQFAPKGSYTREQCIYTMMGLYDYLQK